MRMSCHRHAPWPRPYRPARTTHAARCTLTDPLRKAGLLEVFIWFPSRAMMFVSQRSRASGQCGARPKRGSRRDEPNGRWCQRILRTDAEGSMR
jgi:hypothetical protein